MTPVRSQLSVKTKKNTYEPRSFSRKLSGHTFSGFCVTNREEDETRIQGFVLRKLEQIRLQLPHLGLHELAVVEEALSLQTIWEHRSTRIVTIQRYKFGKGECTSSPAIPTSQEAQQLVRSGGITSEECNDWNFRLAGKLQKNPLFSDKRHHCLELINRF